MFVVQGVPLLLPPWQRLPPQMPGLPPLGGQSAFVPQAWAVALLHVSQKHFSDVNPGAVLRVFPNMTHVLLDASGTDRAASLATYTNTSLPIDQQMAAAVAAFIQQKPVPGDSGPPPQSTN